MQTQTLSAALAACLLPAAHLESDSSLQHGLKNKSNKHTVKLIYDEAWERMCVFLR